MAIRNFKPTSPGRRALAISDFAEITRSNPEKSLLAPLKKNAGRNNQGSITSRRRGGGHKRRYRIIDFKRNKLGVPARVESIEYDPNRSARIALLVYADGERRYILAPKGLEVGAKLLSGPGAEITPGSSLKLADIPLGTVIHNIELRPGKGGQLVRSAGGSAQLLAKEGSYAHIRLPSTEVRLVHVECSATIGEVGFGEHGNINLGKAGRSRWLRRRPAVRGVAMNPVDHPHGGGEGRSSGGRHPVTPWGIPTRGYRTRNGRRTEQFRVTRRRK